MSARAAEHVNPVYQLSSSAARMSEEREKMLNFWASYAHAPNVQSMMLNEDAPNFCEDDRLDIVSTLPRLSGVRVVEMGAGIGRFTSVLALQCKHVLATDFIEAFVLQNKKDNIHLGNVEFLTTDALAMNLEDESKEFVFTNWLLMYLTDDECVQFLINTLKTLTLYGQMHIRESCTERSTRAPTDTAENPTYYRHASQYMELLDHIVVQDKDSQQLYRYRILWVKSVPTYIELKNNWRQVHMMVEKVPIITPNAHVSTNAELVEVLKKSAALQTHWDVRLKVLETLFDGRGPLDSYIKRHVEEMRKDLTIEGVLNLGSNDPDAGLSSFKMAQDLNCCVVGLETHPYTFSSFLGFCNARMDKRVRYQLAHLDRRHKTMPDLPDNSFDMVIGWDSFYHVTDRMNLLRNVRNSLRANGKMLMLETSPPGGSKEVFFNDKNLREAGFKMISVEEVHTEIKAIIEEKLKIAHTKKYDNDEVAQDLLNKWGRWMKEERQWFLVKAIKTGCT